MANSKGGKLLFNWQRESLVFREQGSFRFAPVQRESYALFLDIEILSYVGERYVNLKSNPPYSFYGYATIFEGAVATRKIPLDYARQRIISVVNRQPIDIADREIIANNQEEIEISLAGALDVALDYLLAESNQGTLGHLETVVKVKCPPLTSFRVNCQWLPFDADIEDYVRIIPEDPTDGEDEYPEPARNSVSDPYSGVPASSPIDGANDPRDYGEPEDIPVDIVGTLSYEAFSNQQNQWLVRSKANAHWPGGLGVKPGPEPRNYVVWYSEGQPLIEMANGGTESQQVRFVQLVTSDGEVFVPDPNSITT